MLTECNGHIAVDQNAQCPQHLGGLQQRRRHLFIGDAEGLFGDIAKADNGVSLGSDCGDPGLPSKTGCLEIGDRRGA
jgi:hypothetical protein